MQAQSLELPYAQHSTAAIPSFLSQPASTTIHSMILCRQVNLLYIRRTRGCIGSDRSSGSSTAPHGTGTAHPCRRCMTGWPDSPELPRASARSSPTPGWNRSSLLIARRGWRNARGKTAGDRQNYPDESQARNRERRSCCCYCCLSVTHLRLCNIDIIPERQDSDSDQGGVSERHIMRA